LTNPQGTDINGALSTRAALVAIDRNSWSRSVGMGGRDRRYAHITPLDQHYLKLRQELHQTFETIGFAAA
jgi:hypothetical protein